MPHDDSSSPSQRLWSPAAFREAARHIAAVSQRIYQHGWSPATSSNYSIRLNNHHCAITTSGKDKGQLNEADIMVVNLDGDACTDGKPSAETGLHTQLYRLFPDAGAVLHTHSRACTLLTMTDPHKTGLTFEGFELQKAFEGIHSHEQPLRFPIFDNDQDITRLAKTVLAHHQHTPLQHGYLIRGHGLYTWASDMDSCFRQLEAFEFLLDIEWTRITHERSS